ncbi:DUF1232 domain-containing protein [bacterium]|nr:DUF1232 domain-containing protein [bacterium]
MGQTLQKLKHRARRLESEAYALYLAARHPETPRHAKLLAAGIVAYVFSPIDLIPDFIPILGYVDDLILVPLAILLAIRWIPPPILAECRAQAAQTLSADKPSGKKAAAMIMVLWLFFLLLIVYKLH